MTVYLLFQIIRFINYCKWGILRIFHRNGSISCLNLIWLSVLILYDVTLTAVIMIELYHFTSWFNPLICLCILYVMSWFNSFLCYIHIIIRFSMYNSVWMTFHISIFCHVNIVWTNILYYYRFLSYTCLYEWLFIPNFFSMQFCETGIFSCFLASFDRINRWGRAPWCISS